MLRVLKIQKNASIPLWIAYVVSTLVVPNQRPRNTEVRLWHYHIFRDPPPERDLIRRKQYILVDLIITIADKTLEPRNRITTHAKQVNITENSPC